MDTQKNITPEMLTIDEQSYISRLEACADPLNRLKDGNQYYLLARKQVMWDYYNDIVLAAGDLDEIEDAIAAMDRKLSGLAAEHRRDLEDTAEMLLIMHGVYNPFKIVFELRD